MIFLLALLGTVANANPPSALADLLRQFQNGTQILESTNFDPTRMSDHMLTPDQVEADVLPLIKSLSTGHGTKDCQITDFAHAGEYSSFLVRTNDAAMLSHIGPAPRAEYRYTYSEVTEAKGYMQHAPFQIGDAKVSSDVGSKFRALQIRTVTYPTDGLDKRVRGGSMIDDVKIYFSQRDGVVHLLGLQFQTYFAENALVSAPHLTRLVRFSGSCSVYPNKSVIGMGE